MANRAFKRNVATLQNELVIMAGHVNLSGSTQGLTQTGVSVNGLTGSLPTVLSGSSPNQFVSTYAVTRLSSGSYAIKLADVYPRLLSAQFTIAYPQGTPYPAWEVVQNTTLATRYDDSTLGGVNQIGFSLFSGSAALRTLADPSGSLGVNVSLFLANTSV